MSVETEMKATRIEVPLTLPEPHFEDEATVATARQVVPIERARTIEFWRKLRTVLPILLAATFCGGLGAGAVNYYQRHQVRQTVSQPAPVLSAQPAVTEPSPMAVAASSEPAAQMDGRGTAAGKTQGLSVLTEPEAGDKHAKDILKETGTSQTAPPQTRRADAEPDPAKLTRKRRVHPADERAPAAKSHGASGIVSVFTGPNPL